MSVEICHILLVDDSPDQAEIVKSFFLEQNPPPKVTVAENGPACLKRLSEDRFSAVILDYSLPGMNGLQVLEEIRKRKHDVPVIIVTAQGNEAVAVEAMKNGAFDYIAKIAGYEELLTGIVERSIRQHALKTSLARLEERYQRLVECASDIICLLDLEGNIVMVNDRIEELTRDPVQSLIKKPLADLVFQADRVLFQQTLKKVYVESPVQTEFRVLSGENSTRWISASGTILLEKGSASGAIFILRDISDQKEAQMALVRKNKELQLLLDVSNTLILNHEIDKVLEIFAERLVQAVVTTYVRIFLLEDGKLTVRAAHAIREMEWDSGLTDVFCLDAMPHVVESMKEKHSFAMKTEVLRKARQNPEEKKFLVSDLSNIQSVAMMPVISRGNTLGVVVLGELRNWDRNPLSEGQIALCEAIVHQAAIAVENARLLQSLKKGNLDTIKALGGALETKDLATRDHSDRTVKLSLAVARKMGLSEQEQEWTQYAAILHDIGKIGIPESILNKPAKLTDEEYEVMKRHPILGCEIILQVDFLKPIVPFIRGDHERWDGRGYPDGLAGEEIPLIARIVAVVDAYDAMTSDRVYRKAPGKEYAIRELKRHAGMQFDPKVVETLLEVLEEEEGS